MTISNRDAANIKEGLTELLAEIVAHITKETDCKIEQLEKRLVGEIERKGVDYRGVWRRGQAYARGHLVTHGGSMWIALQNYAGKPGTPNSGWQLAVKSGRDGKDLRDR